MARTLCIPASLLLLAALVLSFLVSVSLPFLPALDIIRINNPNEGLPAGIKVMTELRMGIWTACTYFNDGSHICPPKKLGYEVLVANIELNTIGISKSSWTGALVVHTVATGLIFLAFVTSLFGSLTVSFVAFLVSSFAALITLVAFAIDIALFALVHNLVKNANKGVIQGVGSSTKTAPGFWLSFVSVVLVLLASVTFCFGRRRERRSSESTTYPMQTSKNGKFWEKFNYNGNS